MENLDSEEKDNSKKPRKLEYDDRIFLLINDKYLFLEVDSIIIIKAADDYTEITTTDLKTGLALKAMQEWEARLPEKHFVRIHRSTIININFINRIEKWFNNSFKVFLKDISDPVVISRRYAAKIKDFYA